MGGHFLYTTVGQDNVGDIFGWDLGGRVVAGWLDDKCLCGLHHIVMMEIVTTDSRIFHNLFERLATFNVIEDVLTLI